MRKEKPVWCHQAMTLTGAFLIFFPSGVSMFWGNLSVYLNSYILSSNSHHRINDDDDDNENDEHVNKVLGPWVISTYLVCNSLGLVGGRAVSDLCGRRLTTLVSILLHSGGISLSSLSVRHSVLATCASFGVLTGLGSGLLHANVIYDVIDWSGRRVGFLTQTISTGYNVGSVLINQAVTSYINPNNDNVISSEGPMSYFSQKEILDKVPRTFLYLGIYSISFQIVGWLMIQRFPMGKNRGEKEEDKSLMGNEHDECDEDDENGSQNEIRCYSHLAEMDVSDIELDFVEKLPVKMTHDEAHIQRTSVVRSDKNSYVSKRCSSTVVPFENVLHGDEYQRVINQHSSDECLTNATISANLRFDKGFHAPYQTNSWNENNVTVCSLDERHVDICDEMSVSQKGDSVDCATSVTNGVSPREMFCLKPTYALLSIVLSKHVAFLLLSNYYKMFGGNFIHDDLFLASLGSCLALTSIIAKPFIGWIIDCCGVRTPTLISMSILCFSSGVYYFTPMINRWAFLASSVLFEWSVCLVSSCVSVGTLLILGKAHYTTNFGLLFSVTILLDLLAPEIIRTVLSRWGWFSLYAGTSVFVFLSFIKSLFLLPDV